MKSESVKLIDAHCHINFSAYKEDAAEVIARATVEDIGMIAVGSQSSTSKRAVEYAKAHEKVWAVIGLHPIHLFDQDVDEEEENEAINFRSRGEVFDVDMYRGLIESTDKVVGIGECGLDYYHVPEGVDMESFVATQEKAFRAQLDLAVEKDLPVMVHSRDASDGSADVHSDIRKILKEYIDAGKQVRGDIHCFSGTVDDMRKYVELGMYISFTGNITYKPRKSDIEKGETLIDVVRETPMDRILVETDAPYLTPVPHRGKRNEPAYVAFVADRVAEIKGIDRKEAYNQIMENIRQLFRIG